MVMVHRKWVFCVDGKGHQEEQQAADQIRTRKKKKIQKLKKQEEKRKEKENAEMKDNVRKDIEGNCQWAAAIKRDCCRDIQLLVEIPPDIYIIAQPVKRPSVGFSEFMLTFEFQMVGLCHFQKRVMDMQTNGDQMHKATEREKRLKEAEMELQDATEREQRLKEAAEREQKLLKLLHEQGIQVPT
ncbi:hypothetical protein L208DRAFT_1376830 [Tricholoma matsutake]|nr:hypothetical protein L208DRAFT_1376830 [Tricholoma matsutake 945]